MIKIVIVEDEILVKKGLILTIPWESYGCSIIGDAGNGPEGYDLILKLKPDLVITDVRMPGFDGVEMIRRLKQTTVDTEFIIISGYSEFEYARNALTLGVRDYLVKPFDDDVLENTIKNVINVIDKKNDFNTYKKHMENSDDSKIMLFKEYISNKQGSKAENMAKAAEYIAENFHKDLSLRDISDFIGVSESYLGKLFKSESGYNFNDYLTHYRMKKACLLLNDPTVKIYEVSDKVGYRSQRYFSVIFKKIVGIAPLEFKEKNVKDKKTQKEDVL